MLKPVGAERAAMLVIYSRLRVSDRDHRWIDQVRQVHDPQHRMVAAHFTFVFPFAGVGVDDVVLHATQVSRATAAIHFRLQEAAAVKDPFSPATRLFLLPTDGADSMRELHAQLYDGVLAPHRHPSAPFVPHVTVGTFDQEADAELVAQRLGEFDIRGALTSLLVADFDGRTVEDLCELPLLR